MSVYEVILVHEISFEDFRKYINQTIQIALLLMNCLNLIHDNSNVF